MSLERLKQDWEDLAGMDPLWAVLATPEAKFGKWDLAKFFQSGEEEISRVMQSAARLGYPAERQTALDFGCGVGRLTRALATRFEHCYGVDISESMIHNASELNRSLPNCEFIVNTAEDLARFPAGSFDMIYTMLVLQHLPKKSQIESYLREFVRTLKPRGLLVFQLLSAGGFKDRLRPRSRLYGLLRMLGVPAKVLYEDLGLHPIRASFMSGKEVAKLLRELRAEILEIQTYSVAQTSRISETYWVTK
jgi:ubiquinone/menaquinone biosynthesis C-methylase UbiE